MTRGAPRADAPRALLLMGQATSGDRQFHNQPEHWALPGRDPARRPTSSAARDHRRPGRPDAANLARFDVILNFSTDLVGTDEQIGALLDAVAGGIGYVGLHAANATFRDSDAYAALVGSRFDRHPPIKRFVVEVVDPSHPVTAGIDVVRDRGRALRAASDEAADLQVLARAEGHAAVYVRQYGRGRVCYVGARPRPPHAGAAAVRPARPPGDRLGGAGIRTTRTH